MLFQEQLTYLVNHLYPKTVYPDNKKDWTIGHKCMAYLEKRAPKENILMPSWLALMVQRRLKAGNLFGEEADDFLTIISLANDSLHQLRLDTGHNNNMVSLVKKHKVANCQEFADMAKQWFDRHGVPCQEAVSMIFDREHRKFGGHVFILFHTQTPEICSDFNTAVQHLADPNMYILDLWLGQCAPAIKLMNTYLNLFINPTDLKDLTYAQRGDLVLLQEGLFLKEGQGQPLTEPKTPRPCCVIGTVDQIGRKNKLVLMDRPIRLCQAKTHGINFEAVQHIR